MLDYILMLFFRVPAKNPLTGDTVQQRINEYLCRKRGCITTGPYYGMPQASCCFCGHKNSCANNHVEEWSLPDEKGK